MKQQIFTQQALIGANWKKNVLITIDNGNIIGIEDNALENDEEKRSGTLIPGYFDTQVNGGGGVLFNHKPTPEGLNTIAQAHLQFGTTSMLPTLITDQEEVVQRAADAIAQVIADNHPTIRGVHFEGPHLAKAKKGVHPEKHIRSLSDRELAVLTRNDLGTVMVTIAPETVPVDIIKSMCNEGVLVSLGHSNADSDTVLAALEAGATGFTHLYNAMSPLNSREPGMVGQALLSDAYCGLIVDHQHVHKDSAKLAFKTKGSDRIMLVTDAMAHVGANTNELPFFDTKIIKDGNKLLTPDGTLAGSCLDMHSAVINTHKDLNIPLANACASASSAPAQFCHLHNQIGSIHIGCRADFLLLNEDQAIEQIWLQGKPL